MGGETEAEVSPAANPFLRSRLGIIWATEDPHHQVQGPGPLSNGKTLNLPRPSTSGAPDPAAGLPLP